MGSCLLSLSFTVVFSQGFLGLYWATLVDVTLIGMFSFRCAGRAKVMTIASRILLRRFRRGSFYTVLSGTVSLLSLFSVGDAIEIVRGGILKAKYIHNQKRV